MTTASTPPAFAADFGLEATPDNLDVEPEVSLVLPCLDEAESIAACIAEATATFTLAGLRHEIVVVDNGSTDGSAEIASAHGARVVHEAVPGYGSALRRGILEARGTYVVMADADQTYELRAIPRLVTPIIDGTADMILGERLSSANSANMPFLHRKVGTPVLSWLVRRAAPGVTVSDSQSGFRAFRRVDVLALALQGTGMEFASEMLIQADRKGLRIHEVPTTYRERVGESKLSTFRDGARHLQLIFLLAPHLMLKVPGLVMLAAGLVAMAIGLLSPQGLEVGSVSWQPVFFSSILVVVGSVAIIAAAAVERFSPLAPREHDPASDTRTNVAINRSVVGGCVLVAVGLLGDLALWLVTFPESEQLGRRVALAGVASSAMIVGVVLVASGIVGRVLLGQLEYIRAAQELTDDQSDASLAGS